MKVLLRSDIDGVGKRGDIIDVSGGFARNHLLPAGKAIVASPGLETQAAAMRRSRDLRDARDHESSETVARTLVGNAITLSARAAGRPAVRLGVGGRHRAPGRGADRRGGRPQGPGARRADQDGGRAQRPGRAGGRGGLRAHRGRGRRSLTRRRADRCRPGAATDPPTVSRPAGDDGGMSRRVRSQTHLVHAPSTPAHGYFPRKRPFRSTGRLGQG